MVKEHEIERLFLSDLPILEGDAGIDNFYVFRGIFLDGKEEIRKIFCRDLDKNFWRQIRDSYKEIEILNPVGWTYAESFLKKGFAEKSFQFCGDNSPYWLFYVK